VIQTMSVVMRSPVVMWRGRIKVVNQQKVGVIGGGQLAWMMAIAAQKIGIELSVQAANDQEPAVAIADRVVYGKVSDAKATAKLAEHCPVITFENEFVDLEALQTLENSDRFHHAYHNFKFLPRLATLEISVDKLKQRQHFRDHQIPTPTFYAVDQESDLINAATNLGYPLVLKSRRHGYDGKGTWVVKNAEELQTAWTSMHQVPAIAEAFIPFEQELAVIAARTLHGDIVIYPVVETLQIDQVCRRTIAPARVSPAIAAEVDRIAKQIMVSLDAIGVIGIEFFLTASAEVIVNEIAPRTHNSGHYTIEGCHTSQFEQLLRVVSGLPLGDVSMAVPVAIMINLLGTEGYAENDPDYLHQRKAISSFPNTHIHWYGKSSSLGRKLGHVTVCAPTYDTALAISDRIEKIWYGSSQNADTESISNKRFS